MAYNPKTDKLITLEHLKTFMEGVKNMLTDYLPKTGGTLTGNLIGRYITGTWLQGTAPNHHAQKQDRVAVFDGSGWLYNRTLAEIREDMGLDKVFHVGTTAPTDTGILWIDTGHGGIAKYYDTANKAWTAITSAWK